MSRPVTNEDVRQRLHDYPRDSYSFLGNVTKGVSLAIATTVLLQIVGNFQAEWMRVMPWVTSFGGIVVTYMTWNTGVVLTNSRANIGDSILPLLMSMAEFLLFAVLLKVENAPVLWLNWFALLGIHALIGFLITQNRLKLTRFPLDFEDKELSKIYESWLRTGRKGAAIASVLAFSAWGILRGWVYPYFGDRIGGLTQFGLCAFFALILGRVIYDTDQMRRKSDDCISRVESQGATATSPD